MDLYDTDWLAQLEVAAQVFIAGCLGGLVGLERELAHRPAGLRTHAILAAAAALLVGTAGMLVDHFSGDTAPSILRADPIRVVEALVTGVGFLGAGTNFRNGERAVEGLTTAASMLLVATIGVTVALRELLLAVLVTIFTLVLLRAVAVVAEKSEQKSKSSTGP